MKSIDSIYERQRYLLNKLFDDKKAIAVDYEVKDEYITIIYKPIYEITKKEIDKAIRV
jgi:hypothetical protein